MKQGPKSRVVRQPGHRWEKCAVIHGGNAAGIYEREYAVGYGQGGTGCKSPWANECTSRANRLVWAMLEAACLEQPTIIPPPRLGIPVVSVEKRVNCSFQKQVKT